MSQLEVLVATMHRSDLSLAEKMNIPCDVVIANQADRVECISQGDVRMITTKTRGVGLNRNIALIAAKGELLLFADDDVVYYDGMPEAVSAAFAENPKADVIIFGMDMMKNGQIFEKRRVRRQRLHVWNAMRFGTYRIAVRRQALLRANIVFNQNFGGGCPFSAGEDSLFLKACFDKGLRVYGHPYVLGTCAKDSSSWFRGHNEKYFYDKGVLMRYLFPRMPHLMSLYFGIRFKRDTQIRAAGRVKWMWAGVKGGKTMAPYEEK